MMIAARALSHLELTQGPRTSRSLHKSSRKTLALGSSSPARAWTLVVISPSGAPGISTSAAAPITRALNMA